MSEAGQDRNVEVEVTLTGGLRYSTVLSAASPILRDLHVALGTNRNAEAKPFLVQLPVEGGQTACSFMSTSLVALQTTPPVLIQSQAAQTPATQPVVAEAAFNHIEIEDFVTEYERPDLGGNIRRGDSYTWCPTLWRYLVERFGIKSVLDVGCGEGHTVLFFHRLGVFAHGIDGSPHNVHRAVAPIACHDLLVAPYLMPVDLVWSCEVAEHIDPEKVDNFLDTLMNGEIVAMTHALPSQPGYHHVNCQLPEYWIGKMKQRGYYLSPDNELFRGIAKDHVTWTHFVNTGLVFFRVD